MGSSIDSDIGMVSGIDIGLSMGVDMDSGLDMGLYSGLDSDIGRDVEMQKKSVWKILHSVVGCRYMSNPSQWKNDTNSDFSTVTLVQHCSACLLLSVTSN